jgi:hypothetical protein
MLCKTANRKELFFYVFRRIFIMNFSIKYFKKFLYVIFFQSMILYCGNIVGMEANSIELQYGQSSQILTILHNENKLKFKNENINYEDLKQMEVSNTKEFATCLNNLWVNFLPQGQLVPGNVREFATEDINRIYNQQSMIGDQAKEGQGFFKKFVSTVGKWFMPDNKDEKELKRKYSCFSSTEFVGGTKEKEDPKPKKKICLNPPSEKEKQQTLIFVDMEKLAKIRSKQGVFLDYRNEPEASMPSTDPKNIKDVQNFVNWKKTVFAEEFNSIFENQYQPKNDTNDEIEKYFKMSLSIIRRLSGDLRDLHEKHEFLIIKNVSMMWDQVKLLTMFFSYWIVKKQYKFDDLILRKILFYCKSYVFKLLLSSDSDRTEDTKTKNSLFFSKDDKAFFEKENLKEIYLEQTNLKETYLKETYFKQISLKQKHLEQINLKEINLKEILKKEFCEYLEDCSFIIDYFTSSINDISIFLCNMKIEQDKHKKIENGKTTCTICYKSVYTHEVLFCSQQNCGTPRACVECEIKFIDSILGGHLDIDRLKCDKCEVQLSQSDFEDFCNKSLTLLGLENSDLRYKLEEKFVKLNNFVLMKFFQQQKDIKCCKTPDCKHAFISDDTIVRIYECPLCQQKYCSKCCEKYCNDGKCEENKKHQEDYNDGQQILKQNLQFKRCPGKGCNSIIEKNGGCLIMLCGKCKTRFCFECLSKQPDSTHEDASPSWHKKDCSKRKVT